MHYSHVQPAVRLTASQSTTEQEHVQARRLHPDSVLWPTGMLVPCCAGSTLKLREALVIGGANKLARRMSRHNGYKTLGEHATLAQLHPSTARIAPDDDGLLPEWVVYNEMLATAKTFLSKVCHCRRLPRFVLRLPAQSWSPLRLQPMLCTKAASSSAT